MTVMLICSMTVIVRPSAAQQTAGWGFQILPHLEGDNAWNAGPAVAIATPNKLFFCRSRRIPQTVTFPDEYTPPVTGADVTHGLCDYAASNWEGTGDLGAGDYPSP